MPPRTSSISRPAPSENEAEVICPLLTKEGKPCRKKCLGDKRFRSMQEHIRRAHPERYIAKLPASEESFHVMINTPPNKNVLASQKSESKSPSATGPPPVVAPDVALPDVPVADTPESDDRAPTSPAGVSLGSSAFEPIMCDYKTHHQTPDANLLVPCETRHELVAGLAAASVPDIASAPTLDSEPMSAITEEYHVAAQHGFAGQDNPQAVAASEIRHTVAAPPSVWDQDGFHETPSRALGSDPLFGAERNELDIINGNYPFFDGDCTLFPSNPFDTQTFDFMQYPQARDDSGNWIVSGSTGLRGLGPDNRPAMEVTSINTIHRKRAINDQLRLVSSWLYETPDLAPLDPNSPIPEERRRYEDDGIRVKEIQLGSYTENVGKPGQVYYVDDGGDLTAEDFEMMNQSRPWNDAPARFSILPAGTARRQPETASAAMAKFERALGDEDSILSAAASCGTRRASSPCCSEVEAAEVALMGNFLRSLATTKDKHPKVDVLRTLRGIACENTLKRKQAARSSETSEKTMNMKIEPPDLAIINYPATKTSDHSHKLSVTTNLDKARSNGMVRAKPGCDSGHVAQKSINGSSPSRATFKTTGEAQVEHGQTMAKPPPELDAALSYPRPEYGPLPRQIGLARLQLEILMLNDDHQATKDWKNQGEDTAELPASLVFPDAPKFACPFQAYAATRTPPAACCMQGFAGIDGLKCHLMHTHSQSSSCRLCGISLENVQTPAAPSTRDTGFGTVQAENDRFFMTTDAMKSLETIGSSGSDQDAWWQMFELVVPGLEEQNLDSLRAQYSPYHVLPDADFMVPAITLSSSAFESSRPNAHPTSLTGGAINGPKSPPTPPLGRPSTTTLSVPLYEVMPRSGVESKTQGLYTPPQTTPTEGSDGFESPRANSPPTPMSLSAAQLPCFIPVQHTCGNKTAETLGLQTYERLREHSMQTQAENARLRKMQKVAWEELGCVGSLLGDLLSTVKMPEEFQGKLEKAAQMVATVKDRL